MGEHTYDDDDADQMMDDSSQPLFSLHTLPTRRFYLTRRGKILQSTTERYLRDDLGFGTMLVPASSSSATSSKKAKTETIAGKITQLVPWTIENVPLLWNVLSSSTSNYDGKIRLAVVDTNILLHHMDVLEYIRDGDDVNADNDKVKHYSIANAIVIPQTALEECRNRSLVMYRRAVDLVRSSSSGDDTNSSSNKSGGKSKRKRCFIVFADVHHVDTQLAPSKKTISTANDEDEGEGITINDENDARLRKVALYYGQALIRHSQKSRGDQLQVEVVFLSDDVASRKLALMEQPEEGGEGAYYCARSMREHVTILQKEDPTLNLLDLVAQFHAVSGGDKGGKKRASGEDGDASVETYYTPHVDSSALSHGLQTNRYYQGVYRSNRDSYNDGYVSIRQGDDRVAVVVQGSSDVNRAVDGDIVAVELFSLDKWLGGEESSGVDRSKVEKLKQKGGNDNDGAGIAADTAEPTVKDIDNITEEVAVDEAGDLRRPTGKVVGIIRRNFHKDYCGSLCTIDDAAADAEEKSTHPHDIIAAKHEREHPDGITSTVVFFSVDPRVPPILLRTTQRERLVGMRILVSMDSWPADSEYPLGHYVKTLGVTGTKDTETQVLLQEFRIPCEPFPAKVLACLPPPDYKIELEPGRADLRHIPVLSIDPPGCKDIDDALHCTELPNGNWQVGVHIADVTHYVEAGSAIDLEAANRSTSTYLVNKRLDMLPSLLTTDLCSLKGNVDR